MHVLLLANRPTENSQAATVTEYLDALSHDSEHEVFEIPMLGYFPKRIDLGRFDAVILHYSLSIGPLISHYLGKDLIARLKKFEGVKAAILQDEYRSIHTYWNNIRDLGIDLLISCVPENELSKVYPQTELPDVRIINVLTGYVSKFLIAHETPPVRDRPIDVGYRSRRPPFWLGELGYDKILIADEFSRRASRANLNFDISVNESDRLYGSGWIDFIKSCRCMLGTESGASIIDYDGNLEKSVDEYVSKNPDATFDEVRRIFLHKHEGSLRLHQISPRCFEAIALKTPLVLFEGCYSGLLEPGKHYIELKRDFSNFAEVVEKIKDDNALQIIADQAYRDITSNPSLTYKAFVHKIDRTIEEVAVQRGAKMADKHYSESELRSQISMSFSYVIKRKIALKLQALLMGTPTTRGILFKTWFILPLPVQQFIRPLTRIFSR